MRPSPLHHADGSKRGRESAARSLSTSWGRGCTKPLIQGPRAVSPLPLVSPGCWARGRAPRCPSCLLFYHLDSKGSERDFVSTCRAASCWPTPPAGTSRPRGGGDAADRHSHSKGRGLREGPLTDPPGGGTQWGETLFLRGHGLLLFPHRG